MEINKIGIIGAMSSEITLLKNSMTLDRIQSISGMNFYIGTLENKNIVLVQSGVGKVNAAICAQTLICVFNVDIIINTGVAGALSDTLNIGDIVISKNALQYDVDVTALGYKLSVIPDMETSVFKASEFLITLAFACKDVLTEKCNMHLGSIMTADTFLADDDTKKFLTVAFDGWCCEMEGAAIAQTCYRNSVPFLIIRSISDKADNSAKVSYPEFEHLAAQQSALLLTTLLTKL